ncbi:NAD(+) diphosphatase [Azospirillum sp. sgz301742]
MLDRPNVYACGSIDRAAHRRKDPAWIADARAAPETRIVPVWRARSLVIGPEEQPVAALLPADSDWGEDLVLLGVQNGAALFAVDLSALEVPEEHPAVAPHAAAGGRFVDLRMVGPLMDHDEGSLCAYARGLTHWNARHRFCGVCGSPALSAEGGHVRKCSNPDCATPHFPRTDPAVIMLVHDGGDRCLLGRQAVWPVGMHSTLAGFVEPGECLEEAVAREVFEEVGVRVTDVRYHSSQPWPFPASLMLGFTARALSTEVAVAEDELESARWVTRDFLRTLEPGDDFRMPRLDSISRRLIEDWIALG